jgi:CRP/FNR family transcriptional regulator
MKADSPEEVKTLLSRHFPSFSSELKEEIAEGYRIWSIPAGENLMEIGQKIDGVPLLVEGSVKIFREDEDGNELFLYYLYPGEACAISLVCSSGKERISSIRAQAVEDSHFIVFPIGYMDEWMRKHPSWYEYVLSTYRFRFEEILQSIDEIAFHKLDERLLNYLDKNVEGTGSRILRTSHQDIATELHTSREVISRLLKKLEQRNQVKLSRNQIEVLY